MSVEGDWEGLYLVESTWMTVHLLRSTHPACPRTVGQKWLPVTRNTVLVHRRRMSYCWECWRNVVEFETYIGVPLNKMTVVR